MTCTLVPLTYRNFGAQAIVKVHPIDEGLAGRGVPWWLYLLATLAGLTLLALLIMALWRCGFFKRNRPPRGQALLTGAPTGEPTGEHYGFQGASTGYTPAQQYSEKRYGQRL